MKYWVFFIIYTIILLVFILIPVTPGSSPSGFDKLLHFGAFAVFALLLAIASKNMYLTIVVSIIIATATELLQGYTGREVSFYDWLANISGIIVATFVYRVVR